MITIYTTNSHRMSTATDNVLDMIMNADKFNAKTDITFAEPKVNPKTSGKSVGIINNKNKNSLKLRFPLAPVPTVNPTPCPCNSLVRAIRQRNRISGWKAWLKWKKSC